VQLSEALGVHKGEIISLTGAGGKTTAMYRLATELASQGWRVITTTTTMIRPPSSQQTQELIVEDRLDQVLRLLSKVLPLRSPVTLASKRITAENKLKGIELAWVQQLKLRADVVIIEADGSRGLPLKAPAAYEPVVPEETTLLIPVCGISALGQPLSSNAVHRPDLVAKLTGLAYNEPITGEAIARVLLHPLGGLKGAPAQARVVPLINQVDDGGLLAAARLIAARVRNNPSVDRVLIGAAGSERPVLENWRRVAAVVLAAGGSRRFGRPKQLLPVGQVSMVEHVLRTVLNANLKQVVAVLGSHAEEIAPHVPTGVQVIVNTDWASGISSSIRAGLSVLAPAIEAALFVLADQPQLTQEDLERIVLAYYGSDKSIVVPVWQAHRGSPALFDRCHFDAMRMLQGDVGGRIVIRSHPECVLEVSLEKSQSLVDIDTPSDYETYSRTQPYASEE